MDLNAINIQRELDMLIGYNYAMHTGVSSKYLPWRNLGLSLYF